MAHEQEAMLEQPAAPPLSWQGDDLALAQTIAQLMTAIPGVLGVTAGRSGTAATYGPGRRVSGIIIRRTAQGNLVIETHLVVSGAVLLPMQQPITVAPSTWVPETPILPSLAQQVRVAVFEAISRLGLPPPATVDVVIADLG